MPRVQSGGKLYRIGIYLIVISLITLFHHQRQMSATSLDITLNTIDGEGICLKDYHGKKMVHLLLWAVWCPHCLLEMPKLKRLYDAIGDRPYEILAIDVAPNDSIKRIKQIQEKYQIPCRVIFDREGKIIRNFGVMGVPLHIVIDQEGIEKFRFSELPQDPFSYLNQIFPPVE